MPTGRSHGFLLDNGVFTPIDAPGGASTVATDIDDSGRIVGFSGVPRRQGLPRLSAGHRRRLHPDRCSGRPPPPGRSRSAADAGLRHQQSRPDDGSLQRCATAPVRSLLDNGAFTTVDAPEATGRHIRLRHQRRRPGRRRQRPHHPRLCSRPWGRFTTIDHPEAVGGNARERRDQPPRGSSTGHHSRRRRNTVRGFLRDKGRFIDDRRPRASWDRQAAQDQRSRADRRQLQHDHER